MAGTNDDGVFNVQVGDTLSTDYTDALDASGGAGVVTAVTLVVAGGVSGTLTSTTPIFNRQHKAGRKLTQRRMRLLTH